jgi:hypothetical protein
MMLLELPKNVIPDGIPRADVLERLALSSGLKRTFKG